MKDWLVALDRRLASAAEQAVVRVTVAAVRGSAPRDAGTSMLVGATWQEGTIGGGHMELLATRIARELLQSSDGASRLDRFPLGASLGQCCGGVVLLWFECFDARDRPFLASALDARARGERVVLASSLDADRAERHRLVTLHTLAEHPAAAPLFEAETPRAMLHRGPPDVLLERLHRATTPLWIFGAGHVGRALVATLADLPFDLTWIDSREGVFDDVHASNEVRLVSSPVPAEDVAAAPDDALFLVMTHSHEEDFEICRALLARGAFAWAGLIGSATKWNRFRQRLRARGFAEAAIARIVCPIGVGGIASKEPAAIAIAVAAQLLQVSEAARAARHEPAPSREGMR